MASEPKPLDPKLVELALLICADGRDHPWSGQPCQTPCDWCLNEARIELQVDTVD